MELKKQLKKQISELEEKIEQRDGIYDDRSYIWRKSEEGIEYDNKTYKIIEVSDFIEMALDSLNEYLES